MTRVELAFTLRTALDDQAMNNLARVYSIYGIQKISVAPGKQNLTVEYDATRLRPAEVQAALARAGLPLASEDKG